MALEKIWRRMVNCQLVLCTIIYLLVDAKPTELLQAVEVSAKDGVENPEELWTRLNSDEMASRTDESHNVGSNKFFTLEDGLDFISKIHKDKFVSLKRGCGRGKNMLATLSDGTKVCCRYRDIQWRYIRGEFYSYHLNNFLGLFNAPPASLVKVNYSSPQWEAVADEAKEAGWKDHATIVVNLFIEELTDENFPLVLRDDITVTQDHTNGISKSEKDRLLQWSDLIIFDFIVGHNDRIFCNLFNLQWNNKMMKKPVHNLLKRRKDNKLFLFDNESGFWMGYAIGRKEPSKYELQARFLKKMCVFRDETIKRVKYLLHKGDSPSKWLQNYIKKMDRRSFQMIQSLDSNEKEEFESRLKLVIEQVKKCKQS